MIPTSTSCRVHLAARPRVLRLRLALFGGFAVVASLSTTACQPAEVSADTTSARQVDATARKASIDSPRDSLRRAPRGGIAGPFQRLADAIGGAHADSSR